MEYMTERSGRQCQCGGIIRTHNVLAGKAYTCGSCGRYEVIKPNEPKPVAQEPADGN